MPTSKIHLLRIVLLQMWVGLCHWNRISLTLSGQYLEGERVVQMEFLFLFLFFRKSPYWSLLWLYFLHSHQHNIEGFHTSQYLTSTGSTVLVSLIISLFCHLAWVIAYEMQHICPISNQWYNQLDAGLAASPILKVPSCPLLRHSLLPGWDSFMVTEF